MKPSRDISRLVEIMAALRTPRTGCAWDLEQDFASIAPYTIEEAYEVADAIERADWRDLCDELGDLLLQPVYHARMAEEAGLFDFHDVIEGITKKMIRRHPHVFGTDEQRAEGMTKGMWERIKSEENLEKEQTENQQAGLLDKVPAGLPALQSAVKLQKQATRVGFDWPGAEPVLEKIYEETGELREAMKNREKADIEEEIGDLLFTIANLARHLDIEPDNALRRTNVKFRKRFADMESRANSSGVTLEDASPNELEKLWEMAKMAEKSDKAGKA